MRVSGRFNRHTLTISSAPGALVKECRLCSSKSGETSQHQDVRRTKSSTTSPPPPPPQPVKGGNLLFKLLGVALVGTTGVIGYAWYDDKFRSTVEQRLPYSKETFSYIFKYLPSSREPESQSVNTSVAGLEEVKQSVPVKQKDRQPLEDSKPASAVDVVGKEVDNVKNEERREENGKEAGKDEKEVEETKSKEEKDEKELHKATENAALESILSSLLAETEAAVVIAIELQNAAAAATYDHMKKLRQAMELADEEADREWMSATASYSAKSGTLAQADSAGENARVQLEKLRSVIRDGRQNEATKHNKILWDGEEKLKRFNSDLNKAITQNTKAQNEARLIGESRELLQKAREQFKKETESLTSPATDGKLTEEQLNSLIAHAHRRIEQLQRRLDDHQKGEQARLDVALEKQRQLDEKLAEERLKHEEEILKASFELIADQWALDQRVEFELELRQQLSRQAAAHSDHLTNVLKVNEKKLTENFEKILDNSLDEQRLQFQRDITGWIAKLKGFESALEARAEVREKLRKSQELWLACERLYSIVKNGPDVSDIMLAAPQHRRNSDDADEKINDASDDGAPKMKPLLDEFIAILDAGANHPFVNSVLEAVPDVAMERGVCTARELRQRFKKVHRLCRRVAMIDESGGTLYTYIISYLQSLFLARVPLTVSDQVDLSKLDVFTILDHAEYHLEQGDLETALRFMNQLTGEPRKVASDWIKEARLLLETQRIADALLAHASGDGIGSLF